MRELEKVLKALANRRRLAFLKYLKFHKRASVGELAAAIKLSFKATSKHLGVLKVVDIVESEQVGVEVFYALAAIPPAAAKYIIGNL